MDGQELQINTNSTNRLPTLRDVATPLFRRRKLVLSTFTILALAAILGAILVPKVYQATMEILVKRARVDAAVSPGQDAVVSNPSEVTEEELNSEVELLKSRDLLENVVVSCDLQNLKSKHFWTTFLPAPASSEGPGGQDNEKKISQAVLALEN